MAKINEFTYGKMIGAESRKFGLPYMDWRRGFMNCPGIILIYESERKRPGMRFIYFYVNTGRSLLEDENSIAFQPAYFHTSLGNLSKTRNNIIVDTDNSRYIFEEGDFGLCESDKEFLMFCAGLRKKPERNKNEQGTEGRSS